MPHHWYGVTFDCRDPAALAAFWGALLNMERSLEMDGTGWATLGSRDGTSPRLTFQRVNEPNLGKVRLHLDVRVADIDSARQQIERLGGSWSGVRHDYPEGIVLHMHDPEGHDFCITQFFEPT